MKPGSHHKITDSAARLTFRLGSRDCRTGSRRVHDTVASTGDVTGSVSGPFSVHYDTRGLDDSMECDIAETGASLATQPLNSHFYSYPDSRSEGWNRQMPHYSHVSNEVPGAAEAESNTSDQLPLQNGPGAQATDGSNRELSGFPLRNGLGHAYNEEAFQYFLEIERKRSELSNRPFLLMLVDFNKHPRIDAATADKLFSVLALCLRETDFLGWYREGRVAGAVLTQHGETGRDDLSDGVRQRIGEALRDGLPPGLAPQLQARVYQIPSHIKSGSR